MLISPDLPIVIIGSGPVGDCVVKELLRRAPDTPIVVFNNEPWDPYDRINLVGVLTGQLTWADLYLHKACPLPAGSPVTVHHDLIVAIDRDACSVTDQHGRRHPYSILVLATGSQANRPNMPGIHLQGIYTLRHRGDVEQLV
ncbi:MAG: FAD-dependent oxidoreductase [Gammaproteobacteria bacterium]